MAGSRKHTGKRSGGRARERKMPSTRQIAPRVKKSGPAVKPGRPAAKAKRSRPGTPPRAQGWVPGLLRSVVTLVLVFLAFITTTTFFEGISAVEGRGFWFTAPVYFFIIGAALWFVFRWGFPDGLLYFYVFGHELTHVVFIYLCGGKVYGDIRVSIRGGHVVTNKTNWLISLSPYFVPFYTVIVALGFLFARLFMDLGNTYYIGWQSVQPLYLFYALIGFTWTMHIFFTLTMILRDQPDLHMNGTILSLLSIYLVNSVIVMAFVASASEILTLRDFVELWSANARNAVNLILIRVAVLVW